MLSYQHYSLDLWLTLIRSNPAFKQRRCEIFFNRFNSLQKPMAEVQAVFRNVDLMCNSINEKTGGNIDAEEMYLMVLWQLNGRDYILDTDLKSLLQEMDCLIMDHPPEVYDDMTLCALDKIKSSNATLNILSNTGFIKGKVLRQILEALNLDSYFDFQIYSDEVGMSKPNIGIFNAMTGRVLTNRSISLEEIVHIGDNPLADIAGARQAGINAILVNSNNQSLYNLTVHATAKLFPV